MLNTRPGSFIVMIMRLMDCIKNPHFYSHTGKMGDVFLQRLTLVTGWYSGSSVESRKLCSASQHVKSVIFQITKRDRRKY